MGREDDRSLSDRVETVDAERIEAQSPNRLRELAEQDLANAEQVGSLLGRTKEVTARKTLATLAEEDLFSKVEQDSVREKLGIPTELQKHITENQGAETTVEAQKNAKEKMVAAMQNVENTITAIQYTPGEKPEDLLLRVRAAVHNTAIEEVNRAE